MLGDFNPCVDNLASFAFYVTIGYAWFGFALKRLMMEGWN